MKCPPKYIQIYMLPLGLVAGMALSSCSNSVLFATHTSTGLDVSGDVAKVPDHVNLGFRRREIAYVGKMVPKSASILGRLDSQTNWNGGLAIHETFATGAAAASIADETPLTENKLAQGEAGLKKPLVFSSRTRVGLGLSAGGSDDDAIPSTFFGYTRRIATRMHVDQLGSDGDIPSVVAATSVHGSGIQGSASAPNTKGLASEARLSPGEDNSNTQGGIRIRQFFAVGKGATAVLKTKEEAKTIKESMTQQPEGNLSKP